MTHYIEHDMVRFLQRSHSDVLRTPRGSYGDSGLVKLIFSLLETAEELALTLKPFDEAIIHTSTSVGDLGSPSG